MQCVCQKIRFSLRSFLPLCFFKFFPPQFKHFQKWLWSNPSALSLPIFQLRRVCSVYCRGHQPGVYCTSAAPPGVRRSLYKRRSRSRAVRTDGPGKYLALGGSGEWTHYPASGLSHQPHFPAAGVKNKPWKAEPGRAWAQPRQLRQCRSVGSSLGMRDGEGTWKGWELQAGIKKPHKNGSKYGFWEFKNVTWRWGTFQGWLCDKGPVP